MVKKSKHCKKCAPDFFVMSIKARKRMSNSMKCEKNPMWRDDVGYSSLHLWIKNYKQKPKVCEICKKYPPHDLANISGKYKRDINDFEWLCRKCHMIKDGRLNNLKQRNREKIW